jgi:hypothetical protein
MSAATEAKADQLLANNKVHRLDDEQPRLFMVDATGGGQYRVVIGVACAWCSCPHGARAGNMATCSHARAARELLEREGSAA